MKIKFPENMTRKERACEISKIMGAKKSTNRDKIGNLVFWSNNHDPCIKITENGYEEFAPELNAEHLKIAEKWALGSSPGFKKTYIIELAIQRVHSSTVIVDYPPEWKSNLFLYGMLCGRLMNAKEIVCAIINAGRKIDAKTSKNETAK